MAHFLMSTRIHMGQQTRTNSFHRVFSCDRTAFYCITEYTKIRVSFCFFSPSAPALLFGPALLPAGHTGPRITHQRTAQRRTQ